MGRGRKGAPAEIAAAKGNPGRRPRAKVPAEPVVSAGGLVSPLPLNADESAMWRVVVSHMEALNLIRPSDAVSVARYACYLVDWIKHRQQIDREGATNLVKSNHNPEGLIRKHPLLDLLNSLESRLIALEDRYGLSPRSRQELLLQVSRGVPSQNDLYQPAANPAESSDGPLGILLN